MQGKADEAEKYFLLALQEAKEGFGERDGHVASACNNLVSFMWFLFFAFTFHAAGLYVWPFFIK